MGAQTETQDRKMVLSHGIALLVAEMCGYNGPRCIQTGAAIELLHTATLLHDDVVDLSELRRGQPSANLLLAGPKKGVSSGNFFSEHATLCSAVKERASGVVKASIDGTPISKR